MMSRTPPIQPALRALRDDPDRLIQIILDQAEVIAQLQDEIEKLKRNNNDLDRRARKAARGAKRQAAPFRLAEKKRKTEPKKPGRKGGH